MKTWDEIRDETKRDSDDSEDLQENRLVRKGLGLAYSSHARTHGNSAETNYKKMSQNLSGIVPDGDIEKRLIRIENSLKDLSEGLINTRKQLGSMTAMMNVMILLNERTDDQLKNIGKKRR